MDNLEKRHRIYQHIHRGLHNHNQKIVVIDNKQFPIMISNNGKRFIRTETIVFSQHETEQKTKMAMRARLEPITRIMRSGARWGWISNTEINDPELR